MKGLVDVKVLVTFNLRLCPKSGLTKRQTLAYCEEVAQFKSKKIF